MRSAACLLFVLLYCSVDSEELVRVTLPSTTTTRHLKNHTHHTAHNETSSDSDYSLEKAGQDASLSNELELPNQDEERQDEEKRISGEFDEAGQDKSDISEETNKDEFENVAKPQETIIASHINQSFVNKQSFTCPRVKTDLLTGTSVGDLSPEDIQYVASMGDGVASGAGLFNSKQMGVEFRGWSFASGGDANIDGLVTIPNILREFSPSLTGQSHGDGKNLNSLDLSVSSIGATTSDLPRQARELVRRFEEMKEKRREERGGLVANEWVLVVIAIGTEEICQSCKAPDTKAISEALAVLYSTIKKALVILIGPTHVSHQMRQRKNILKYRCDCSKNQSAGFMESLADKWIDTFNGFQKEYDTKMETSRPTWGLLALPQLTITSRTPELLFHEKQPILSRRGHAYMAKWLWNRLMTGERYNLSSAVLSSDSYYCPSSGCPYFRTTANMRKCAMLSLADAAENQLKMGAHGEMRKEPRRTRRTLYSIAIAVVVIAFFVALLVGSVIYQRAKMSLREGIGRYGDEPILIVEKKDSSPMLERQSSRFLDVPSPVGQPGSRPGSRKTTRNGSENIQLLSQDLGA